MRKNLIVLLSIIALFHPYPVQAQSCSTKDDCEKTIREYESKLSTIREQKNTLSSQISYMDTQINLTTYQILNTELQIKKIESEIESLGTRIEDLDQSLNYLSEVFLQKVIESYKRKQSTMIEILLDSDHVSSLTKRIKYIRTAQENDRKLAVQVQQTKVNFEEQKSTRENKVIELDNLNKQLGLQKIELTNQKLAKQRLLEVTKNDEQTYQRLLSEAQRQLSGFRSFVKSAGGGIIGANGFGSGSDGWYYSQRDSRWANYLIGNSSENILDVGCLITDIAMILNKYGSSWTPIDIASKSDYFLGNTAYMIVPSKLEWPIGLSYVNIPISNIESEINEGRPVIVGLNIGPRETHYVVLKEINDNGYIMHDPYYGPDKKFTDYYSMGSIFVAGVFK